MQSTAVGTGGAEWKDLFYYWIDELHPNHKLVLLPRDKSYLIKNIEISMHGDQGLNGGRGSLLVLSKIGVKSIQIFLRRIKIDYGC